MSDLTDIESYNLADMAISLITHPSKIYSATEAANVLSMQSDRVITEEMYMEFRTKYMNGDIDVNNLPKPVVQQPTSMTSLPRSLDEMCAFSQINTMGLREGIINQSLRTYTEAAETGETSNALKALKLMLEASDSMDKQLRAIQGTDPAADLMSQKAFQNFKQNIIQIANENPEYGLLDKLKSKMSDGETQDET